MLVNNINYLKQKYPHIREQLRTITENGDQNFKIEETKSGEKTLLYKNKESETYIHSKYNPIREAEAIIDTYQESIQEDTIVLFYGLGLGYHIDVFERKYPNNRYYIYEPIEEIIYAYLCEKELSKLKGLESIEVGINIKSTINSILEKSDKNIIIELPSHTKNFDKEYRTFTRAFKIAIESKRSNIGTNLNFQKDWTTNSMKNFKHILNTPNILIENKGRFKNKPAIIVSAGPSLDEDIESIRYIKENKLAYVFSAGSSINSLINNNIYPDAVCTYDPGKPNRKVFDNIIDKDIIDVPIIFGSSVNSDIVNDYKYKKYHTLSSQDSVSGYYIDTKDIKLTSDASTVAIITLSLLHELGFNPIILAGQNLGYQNGKTHAKDNTNVQELTEKQKQETLSIEDVYGNSMITSKGYNTMRLELEHYIEFFSDTTIINTTKNGAKIRGANFIEIERVIEQRLKEKVVDQGLVESINSSYDNEYIYSQHLIMKRAFRKVTEIIKEYKSTLNKIDLSIRNKNIAKAETLYIKLDKVFKKFEDNEFIKTFILPMSRVQYKILVDSIDSINLERDKVEKGEKIVRLFKGFLTLCSENIESLSETYEEMSKEIEEYCEKSKSSSLEE